MKTIASTLLLAVSLCNGAAQGFVDFRNNVQFATPDPTGGNRLVYNVGSPLDPVAGVKLIGTNYVAELYFGPNAGSLQPVPGAIAKFRSTSTAQPGTWNYPGQVALPGFDIGSTPTLQVRVWDITQFASYEAAFGKGITSESMPFLYVIPPIGCDPNCYSMEGLRAFALVPEPSVFALGAFAVAVLLVFCRGRRANSGKLSELPGRLRAERHR